MAAAAGRDRSLYVTHVWGRCRVDGGEARTEGRGQQVFTCKGEAPVNVSGRIRGAGSGTRGIGVATLPHTSPSPPHVEPPPLLSPSRSLPPPIVTPSYLDTVNRGALCAIMQVIAKVHQLNQALSFRWVAARAVVLCAGMCWKRGSMLRGRNDAADAIKCSGTSHLYLCRHVLRRGSTVRGRTNAAAKSTVLPVCLTWSSRLAV